MAELGNLDIQRQINELLEDRTSIYNKHSDILKGQAELALNIAELLGKDTSGFRERISAATESLDAAAAAADRAAESTEGVGAAAAGAAEETGRMGAMFNKASEMGKKALTKVKDVLGGILDTIRAVSQGVLGIATGIMSIPLNVLSFLQEKAAQLARDSIQVAQAYEDIRDKFGSLKKNEGKAVVDSFKEISKESGSLAGSGRSLASIYGTGPGGVAEAIRELGEVAGAMGPVFGALKDQLADAAAEVLILRKGLGLTSEELKALGATALARGENMADSMREIGNLSVQMGNKFGISSKLIGKQMGYMTSQTSKFGSMTKAQMATSITYLHKLGLEIKDVEGLMGAFDDFETAAGNASKLAQSFNMNVDAMEMMKEKDPGKRLDMLRKSFAATGKSIDDMTRQEKELLATTAGLDANLVESALSAKNMGLSYEEIQNAAEGAADKQLTQEEIMKDMADNIKKVIEPFEYVAGLLQNLLDGFATGMMRSKPVMDLLRSISRLMKDLFHFGLELGSIFVNSFPGVKDMFSGLMEMFNSLRASLDVIKAAFFAFFVEIQIDPVQAVQNLMTKLKNVFFSQFDASKGGGKFIAGLKTFGITIAKTLFGFGKYLLDAVIQGAKDLLAWFKNPTSLSGGMLEGIARMMSDAINYLSVAVPELWDTFVKLLENALPMIWEWLKGAFSKLWASNFGKALIAGAALFIAGPYIKDFFSTIFGGLTAGASGAAGGGGFFGAFTEAFKSVLQSLTDLSAWDIYKLGWIADNVATFIEERLPKLTAAFALASEGLRDVGWSELGKTMAVLAVSVSSMWGLGKAIQAVGELDWEDIGQVVLIGIVALITDSLIGGGNDGRGMIGAFKDMIVDVGSIDGMQMLKGFGMLAGMLASMYGLALVVEKVGPFAEGVLGGAKLYAISLFVEWMGGFLSTSLKEFANAVQAAASVAGKISLEEIAKLAAVIGLVGLTAIVLAGGGALGAVGGLASAVADGGILGGIGFLFSGGYDDAKEAPSVFKTVSGILSDAEGPLGDIVDSIQSIANKIVEPEKLQAAVQAITGVIGVFAPLLEVLSTGLTAGMQTDQYTVGGDAADRIDKIMKSLKGFLSTTLSNMSAFMSKVIEIAQGINLKPGDSRRVRIFGTLMGAVGELMSAIFEPLKSLGSMKVDGTAGVNFSASLDALKQFMFGNAKPPTEDTTSFMYKIRTMLPSIISAVDSVFKNVSLEQIQSLPDKTNALADSVRALLGIGKAFSEMSSAPKIDLEAQKLGIVNVLSGAFWGLNTVSQWMPAIVGVSNGIAQYKESTIGSVVQAITDDIVAVNEALGDLGEIKMDATIEKVGKTLGIKDTVLKIDRKPIQMNVQLNLTMKSEDLAKEVFKVTYDMMKEGEPGPATKAMNDLLFPVFPA